MLTHFKKLTAAVLSLTIGAAEGFPMTIHTIGDSTMATYDESSTEKRGWCQMFQQFFNENEVTINNRAKSGASSKTFYRDNGYWNTVIAGVEQGDYVFIQFAHNDEKNNGYDGDSLQAIALANGETASNNDYRGTTASGTFKQYIRSYITETKAKGGNPVIVTPICRKYFNTAGTVILRNGQHDLGDKFGVPESNDYYDYAQSLRDLAKEYGLPLIDLTKITRELYLSYGDTYCTERLFCNSDKTHLKEEGATLVAKLCAKAMKEQGILAEYINLSNNISVAPSSGDFGTVYTGNSSEKVFAVTANNLSSSNGNITLKCSNGYEISVNGSTYSSEATLSYSNSSLNQNIIVRATVSDAGIQEGTLSISDGTDSKTVTLKAEGVLLPKGKETFALWRLESGDESETNGFCKALEQKWSGMEISSYQAVNKSAVWPTECEYDSTHSTQRNVIAGKQWPANEIDEVSTRYIEFGLEATDSTLSIDRISLFIAGAGGNGMRCKIYYSTDPTFGKATLIKEFPSMVSNNVYKVEATLALKLAEGEKIYLRVYPWYSMEATGKTICLSDVLIHGYSDKEYDPTRIDLSKAEAYNNTADIITDIWGRRPTNLSRHQIYISNGRKFMIIK